MMGRGLVAVDAKRVVVWKLFRMLGGNKFNCRRVGCGGRVDPSVCLLRATVMISLQSSHVVDRGETRKGRGRASLDCVPCENGF